MTRRLFGFSTLHTIMEVSKLPEATKVESGLHATQFTLAEWKPHSSSLVTFCENTKVLAIEMLVTLD